MLALTFADPADYDKIRPSDRVDILGLESFAPGKNLTLVAKHEDGTKEVGLLCFLLFLRMWMSSDAVLIFRKFLWPIRSMRARLNGSRLGLRSTWYVVPIHYLVVTLIPSVQMAAKAKEKL